MAYNSVGKSSLRSSTDQNRGSNISNPEGPDARTSDTTVGDQGEDRQKLAYEAKAMLDEAKEYRNSCRWDKSWDNFLSYFMGIQKSRMWRSTGQVNLIRPIIESIIAHMTDSNPDIQVDACEEAFVESADVMQQVLYRTWLDNNMRVKLNNTIRDTMIYGTSYLRCYVDNYTKKIVVDEVDVRSIYPSPGATSFEDANYVIYAENIPKANIEAKYPDCVGKLDSGLWDENLTIVKNITSTRPDMDIPGFYTIPGQYPGIAPKSGGRGADVSKHLATYIEYWYRDKKNPEDIWVVIAANGYVLSHKKNPYKHKKYPFVKFIDTGLTRTWYGTGEVHHLQPSQDSLNDRRTQAINLFKLVANPPFLKPYGCGIPDVSICNAPGIQLTYQGNVPPQWMKTGEINPAFFTINALDKQEMEQISGITDISQGRKPKGVTSGEAIAYAEEIGNTIIRPKIRLMEAALTQLGELMFSNIQQFYDKQMIIRVAGRRADKLGNFIKVNVPAVKQDENGNWTPTIKNDLSLGKYDVNISVGSEPDHNKATKFEQMMQLRNEMGPQVITDRMLLETVPDFSQEQVDATLMGTAGPGALPGENPIPNSKPPRGMAPPPPAAAPQPGAPSAAGMPPGQPSLIQAQNTAAAPPGVQHPPINTKSYIDKLAGVEAKLGRRK